MEAIIHAIEAAGAAEAEAVAAAFTVGATTYVEDATIHAFLEDDVDHASDRIGAIQ